MSTRTVLVRHFQVPYFHLMPSGPAIFRSSCSRSCIVSPLVYSLSSCEHVNCRTAAAAANPRCFICVQSCLHRQTQEILISKILEISKARRTNHWKSKYCRTFNHCHFWVMSWHATACNSLVSRLRTRNANVYELRTCSVFKYGLTSFSSFPCIPEIPTFTYFPALSHHSRCLTSLSYFLLLVPAYTVWVKKIPLRFSDIFPKRLVIFNQFYTPIIRYYLR